MTIAIELASCSLAAGSRLTVRVKHAFAEKFRQIQIEIFDVGVLNPSPKLGVGTAPTIVESNVATVDIDSTTLPLGVYEIRLVRLHDPMESNLPQQLDYVPVRDFSRQLFEIGAEDKASSELLAAVEKRESMLERSFFMPVDIREAGDQSISESYCTFVFVRDVLIGTPIRFHNFELLPTHTGLDSKDSLDFVNTFLKKSTSQA